MSAQPNGATGGVREAGPSASVRERVERARERQRERFAETQLICNADMQPADVRVHCQVDRTGKSLLKAAMSQSSVSLWTLAQLQLSVRAYHRILKLAPREKRAWERARRAKEPRA